MEMSPQRVRSAEFKTVRKGADPDEVQVFLNDVADELERAQNQSTAMEARARAAVARLQELNDTATGTSPGVSAPPVPAASVDEAETISRTLLLAQRTADSTVAEARAEAARVVRDADTEATSMLDAAREMATRLNDEARSDARQAGETERISVAGEVDALKARRDFLESDVEQLELFLTDQRARIREAATSLVDIVERVPGGLGPARQPLLSASDDTDQVPVVRSDREGRGEPSGEEFASSASSGVDAGGGGAAGTTNDLLIVTDLEDAQGTAESDLWLGNGIDDPTQAMPMVTNRDEAERPDAESKQPDEILFSFDDDRL